MINHSTCDHPSTSGARAKCRRARQNDDPTPKVKGEATPKHIGPSHHDPTRERNRGTTPRDRDKQCHICGVERIEYRGTDALTGILLYVGERCLYMVKSAPDLQSVEA